MKTPVCEMLGVDVPILAFTHCRDVVAAVTKAGGFGVLGAAGHTPEQLDIDLQWIREEVGDKPFGVDIIVPAKYEGSAEGGKSLSDLNEMIPQGHRDFVDDMMERYAVPPLPKDDGREGRGGLPVDSEPPMTYAQAVPLMDVAFSHPIKLIVNALGPPPPDMIERAHANDVLVGALAGKKSHAVRHVAAGVDIIIAQGHEAGGHTGDIGTMVLVPEIVDAVAPTPVLAAGGIGSGRQVAASIALGAQGVWCGSVWLTTQEAETHPVVKEKFLTATSSDTLRSRSRTGKPARQLRSAWTDEWEGDTSPGTLPMPLQPMLIAHASRRVDRAATNPENRGAVELANYFVGQIVGSMNESISATRVVEDMITEYLDVMDRFEQLNT
ncbi:MAG: nitronate monooxygenase [Actinomycetota bacterium]|uniref:Nitronate monooxygenase domain-containing protein n=1 Tax=marine metagenome TaxID=408172 RepID=A0A381QI27_9ZZZZ|nr:nitronate monooxygenase [Acidimicrobiales bacterium]MEC8921813.1 nitronate monooxygenase [Actinomycetota bacterium]MEC9315919.1 nitronate monooxygenase [Actinomycetota bacterium]MED5552852.1 nitronate monooxygenase [Actinomycetota bacterium]MEE3187928.1 nitronate monooxygenase [Actinomycetota bacterium]